MRLLFSHSEGFALSIRRSPHLGLPRSYLVHLIISVLGLLALTGSAFAGSVNLAWDSVSGASGYRVYYGTTSANYTANSDAGSKTSATVAGLTDGSRYYFAVQAYAGTVNSGYSNEVNTVVTAATTAPVASFTANGSTASSLSVTQGQTVTLIDTSTGTVASRSWNLGDGNSATSPTVVQSYATTGAKTVALSVTGAGVTRTASKTINVTAATPGAPVAGFSASPVTGTAPLAVKFTDGSSGSVSSWSWSFGDSGTSAAQSPTHTYTSAGTYTVALTATGPGGSNTVTKTKYITVTASGGSSSGGTGVTTTPYSLWDNTATPSVAADSDTRAVELGVKIRSNVDGLITGVRFYKDSRNTGTHVGRLWSSSGQLLAQATFTNETASGWQQVSFATPVAIKANTVYVVSYHAPVGRYSADFGYFQTADTNGPLRALASR